MPLSAQSTLRCLIPCALFFVRFPPNAIDALKTSIRALSPSQASKTTEAIEKALSHEILLLYPQTSTGLVRFMAKILLEDAIDVAIMFRVPLDFRPDTIRRAFFALLQTEGSQGVQRLARQLYGPLLPIMHYNITTNNALLALRDSPPTTPELLNIVLQLTTLSKASPNLLSRVQQCQDAYESLPIAARTALVASGRKTFDLTLKQGIAYEYSSCDAATKKTLHDLMGAPQLIKALTETSGRPEGGFFLLVHQTKGTKPGTVYALVDELLQEWYRPVHQIMLRTSQATGTSLEELAGDDPRFNAVKAAALIAMLIFERREREELKPRASRPMPKRATRNKQGLS